MYNMSSNLQGALKQQSPGAALLSKTGALLATGGTAMRVGLQVSSTLPSPITYLVHLAPTYLADDINLVADSGRRLLQSSADRTDNTFDDRSFAAANPRVWNNLRSVVT